MGDIISDELVEYTVEVAGALPQRAVEEVKRRVLDSFGCALRALRYDGPQAALEYAQQDPRADGVRLWGTGLRASTETAALVNGTAVRFLDWNDSYFSKAGSHPSDLIPGILAVGEATGSSGRDVVHAICLGYDILTTLSDTFNVQAHGWDHVNVTGIGACCAVGRLLGLDRRQLRNALALQVTPHAATRQSRFGELSMWKNFAAADAVRHAVYAASLAKAGVQGPPAAFGGQFGFVNQLLDGEVPDLRPLAPLRGRQSPGRVQETHIKVWPFGYVAQSAVEAAEAIYGQLDGPELIETVQIVTFETGREFMCGPEKWRPTTPATADHSMPYVVAEMLRRGVVDEESFTPARFASPDAYAFLRDRVEVTVDDRFTARYGLEFPARIVVTTVDGRQLVEERDVPAGHASKPLSRAALAEKYHAGADPILGVERATELAAAVSRLEELGSVAELTELTVA